MKPLARLLKGIKSDCANMVTIFVFDRVEMYYNNCFDPMQYIVITLSHEVGTRYPLYTRTAVAIINSNLLRIGPWHH